MTIPPPRPGDATPVADGPAADEPVAGPRSVERLRARIHELETRLEDERATVRALRRSETRLREALEIETVGVIFWGPDLTIRETNGAFLRMCGFGEDEVIGRTWQSFTPEEFHPASERFIAEIEATGEGAPYEKQYHHADGSRWWGLFAARRIGEGEIVEYVLDVTDRKETEQALAAAKAEAERASLAKGRFLSTMSHELRTPLAAVVGFADLLQLGLAGPLNEDQDVYISRIKGAARHQVSIIDDILAFSRSEAGQEEVRWEEADVAEVTRHVHHMLEGRAEARGLPLRLHGAEHPVTAVTDPGKVRRILTNLVGNALKYTDDGAVDVELEDGEAWIEVRVRDTGAGIPVDRLEEIFDPFIQVDQSTTREKDGTGLGLTISRRLARLLGGDVGVASVPGEGSTFSLRLPRRPPDRADGALDRADGAPD